MVAAVPSIIERLPPHNVEAEQSVLGSLLIDRDAIIRVAAFLRPEDFYAVANGLIYRAILDLYNKREPTDFVTLSDELQRRGQYDQAGGLSYLSSLLNAVPTAVHVEYYARIVERAATLRRLIDAGTEIVDVGFREGIDTEDALDAAERAVFAVSQRRQTKDFVSMGDVLDRFFDQIDYLQQHRGEVVGVATGFSDLDQLTGGLQRSDLIIVAARPVDGQDELGARHGLRRRGRPRQDGRHLQPGDVRRAARAARPLHGDRGRYAPVAAGADRRQRVGPHLARVRPAERSADLHRRRVDLQHHGRPLQGAPLAGRARSRSDHRRLPAADDRPPHREPRAGDLGDLARAEGAGARAERAGRRPVAALPRGGEPLRSQADALGFERKSGSIEQDADIVIFIYREDKYEDDSEKKGIAEIIVAKHRNGPVGSINLRFFDRTARFADLELYPGPGM